MATEMQDSEVGDSTFQLVIDQLEELVVTIVEELRERPGVALAIFAGIVGALVGSRLASRSRPRNVVPERAKRAAGGVGDAAELAGLGLRLLRNPIVRGLIAASFARQFRRRATP
jgi:hypothetical protein